MLLNKVLKKLFKYYLYLVRFKNVQLHFLYQF